MPGHSRSPRRGMPLVTMYVASLRSCCPRNSDSFSQNDKPTIASHMIKTGRVFSASLELLSQMRLISVRVNVLVKAVDPIHYAQMVELRAAAELKHKFFEVIGTGDPLNMEGRELIFNRQTPLHPDRSDHWESWACIMAIGPFKGGPLHIPSIGLRMEYWDGTMILLRGKILKHEVEAFSGGQRISIAHFTHRSFWKSCGVVPTAQPLE